MSRLANGKRATIAVGLAVAVGTLMALSAWGGASAASAPLHLNAQSVPASGTSQQWAFGGHAGASYSCSSTCGSSSVTSLGLSYYVEWVVIYTATNVSSTQTEFEVQSAINASLSLSAHECLNESLTGPCSDVSLSASLSGLETASGFTNVTNTGSVNLTSGSGAPGPVSAMAVTNAQSMAAFNFSGSFSETLPINGTTQTLNAVFDLGGNENAAITFGSPLGVVPINPQPGQSWNSSAPFSATGSFTSGYSLTANGAGHSESENHWTSASVSPSGTLALNGSDLGAVTLYDNYTNPPTTVQAQVISLSFGSGGFVGTHGWLLVPSGLYGGALGGLSGVSLIARQPSATVSGGESADYESGVGFVGENEAANGTSVGVGSTGPSLNLQAGPEPVSVADQQLSAITSSSSSTAFPWVAILVAVVVVIAVLAVVAMVMRSRSKRAPPAQTAPPPGASPPQ